MKKCEDAGKIVRAFKKTRAEVEQVERILEQYRKIKGHILTTVKDIGCIWMLKRKKKTRNREQTCIHWIDWPFAYKNKEKQTSKNPKPFTFVYCDMNILKQLQEDTF